MIAFNSSQHYFLYREPTDMRKSFNGLSGLVRNELKTNPLDGSVYIFMNRRRDRIKLLIWDRTGFVIYYKRLEQGTFELPLMPTGELSCKIRWAQLVCMLEGVSLKSVKMRKRYAQK